MCSTRCQVNHASIRSRHTPLMSNEKLQALMFLMVSWISIDQCDHLITTFAFHTSSSCRRYVQNPTSTLPEKWRHQKSSISVVHRHLRISPSADQIFGGAIRARSNNEDDDDVGEGRINIVSDKSHDRFSGPLVQKSNIKLSIPLSSSKKRIDDGNSRRRFAQVEHKSDSLVRKTKTTYNEKSTDQSSMSRKSLKEGSSSRNKKNRPKNNFESARSIEELESNLLKRWGTDLSAWTAKDTEYDEVDDDETDDDKVDDDTLTLRSTKTSKKTKISMKTSKAGVEFRAKPVKDPLFFNDYESIIPKKQKLSSSGFISHSSIEPTTATKEERMFNRVLANQQRLIQGNSFPRQQQLKNGHDSGQVSAPKNDVRLGTEQTVSPNTVSSSRALTPERITGSYVTRNNSGEQRLSRPLSIPKQEINTLGHSETPNTATYFFNTPPPINQNEDIPECKASPSSNKKQVPLLVKSRVEVKPLYNEDDNTPMFLTLDQAVKNFQMYLSSSSLLDRNPSKNYNVEDSNIVVDSRSKSSNTTHFSFPAEDFNISSDVDSAFPPSISTTRMDKKMTSSKAWASVDWTDIGIKNPLLLRNLQVKMGLIEPLYVQQRSCSVILQDEIPESKRDILLGTYTGSGKTLAFLVPTIQRLLLSNHLLDSVSAPVTASSAFLRVLIVAPGRELASQIASVSRQVIQDIPNLNVVLAIGGTTYARNLEQIRKKKPAIIVGTPGRIAELIVGRPGDEGFGGRGSNGRVKISNVQTLILDEFDALLQSKTNRDPTEAILEQIQKQHRNRDSLQSIFCSATSSDLIGSATLEKYLHPKYISIMADAKDAFVTSFNPISLTKTHSRPESSVQVSRTVIHGVVHVEQKRYALDMIRKILHTDPMPQQVLLFVENARKVDRMVEQLLEMNIIAAPLHGGMGSDKVDRATVSQAFRDGYVGIVVATELAARGLDAPLLTHVINVDLPTDASHYAHRAGRTGRGNARPGVVINLTTGPAERNVPHKFAKALGISMFTVDVKNGRLNVIDPATLELDK